MINHPAFIAMQVDERHAAMRALAAPQRRGGGTPLLARLAAHLPQFRRATPQPTSPATDMTLQPTPQ